MPRRPPRRKPVGLDVEAQLARAIEPVRRDVPCLNTRALWWISEDADERALAAAACQPCPVLLLCRRAGRVHVAGVWGGDDRTCSADAGARRIAEAHRDAS